MNPTPASSELKCFQCGSPLIQTSKVTSHPEGSLFPQTAVTYRCSNKECQDQKDKDEAKRIKLRDDKLEADKKRAEEKQKRYDEKVLETIGKEEQA